MLLVYFDRFFGFNHLYCGKFAVSLHFVKPSFQAVTGVIRLVLVHDIKGKMMEKYYLIATAIISLGLTVPAYGLDQFGYVPPP